MNKNDREIRKNFLKEKYGKGLDTHQIDDFSEKDLENSLCIFDLTKEKFNEKIKSLELTFKGLSVTFQSDLLDNLTFMKYIYYLRTMTFYDHHNLI
jgi:hypothetical protein